MASNSKENDHNLKRSCSSLSMENVCTACGATFGSPSLLDRHQKSLCSATNEELRRLQLQVGECESAPSITHRASKRRRTSGPGERPRSSRVFRWQIATESPRPQDYSSQTGAQSSHSAIQQSGEPARVGHSASPGMGSDTRNPSGSPFPRSVSQKNLLNGPELNQTASGSPAAPSLNHDVNLPFATNQNMPPPSHSSALPEQASPSSSRPGSSNTITSLARMDLGQGSPDTAGSASALGMKDTPSSTTPSILDALGLRKKYPDGELAGKDPDVAISSIDLYDSTHHLDEEEESAKSTAASGGSETAAPATSKAENDLDLFAPFPNRSSFDLGEWFYGLGTQKSLNDFKALVTILKDPAFSLDDIKDTKWTSVFRDLGKNKDELQPSKSQWIDDSGWKITNVEIEIPIHSRMAQGSGVEKRVAGTLHHRSIVSILEERIRNAHTSQFFHLDGHELLWKPDPSDPSPEFRVLSELYNCDAFLKAQREIRDNPPPEIAGCELPRVVVGLMLWSDGTHLSTFSTAKLWPLYMVFGNESKYRRGKGASDPYHVAYFDSISDSFKDYITERTGGKVPPNLAAHLNREFFHAQWFIILDDELLKAIVEGIIIECSDGVKRRFFIRIFTYAADYPEKVLIATIKSRSDCPCVRCLIKKKDLNQMGTVQDLQFREAHPRIDSAARREEVLKAREAIEGGLAVGGDSVLRLLSHSGVPVMNAFSSRLSHTGFDIFSALVVDVLHEFEVGAWKALLLHLIRVLEASGSGSVLVHLLDKRYRSMPTFNQTIRKFSANMSQLRRRAARDYEDALQCAIPAFQGLLPEPLNGLVLRLLYINARWHALAKLRMQTEATVTLLEEATSQLGDQFRAFIKAVDKINTKETASEARKREKTQKTKDKSSSTATTAKKAAKQPSKADGSGQKTIANRTKPDVTSHTAGKAATLVLPSTSSCATQLPDDAAATPRLVIRIPPLRRSTHTADSFTVVQGTSQLPGSSITSPFPPPPQHTAPCDDNPCQSSGAFEPAVSHLEEGVSHPGSSTRASTLTSQPPATATTAPHPSPAAQGVTPSEPVTVGPLPPDTAGVDKAATSSSTSPALQGEQVSQDPTAKEPAKASTRRSRKLNIHTVKFHALGHYPSTIRLFGPTDLFSTEWGEGFHRSPKAWFKSTSKKYIRKELSRHERKRARLRKTKERILSKGSTLKAKSIKAQRLAARDPDIHHYIGISTHSPVYLLDFAMNGKLSADIASASFVRNLKQHLFHRFLSVVHPCLDAQGIAEVARGLDWSNIILRDDRMYTHRIMRIKYTTYDARRDEDIIHIETNQTNVMLLNRAYSYGSQSHPFTYCKVIAILHADISFIGGIGRRGFDYVYHPMEFLWVRKYRVHPSSSLEDFKLDEAELLAIDEPASHCLIDPAEVLRACHIVPNFTDGLRYPDGNGKSAIANDAQDYRGYFVNRFVDRDMFMRYEWGLAVGHGYTHRDAVRANEKVIGPSTNRTATNSQIRLGSTPSMTNTGISITEGSGQGGLAPEAGTGATQDVEEVETHGPPEANGEVPEDEEEEDIAVTDDEDDHDDDHDDRDSEEEKEIDLFG